MIVVADTTPLNYLILMGEDRMLGTLYGRVLVPKAVLTEMLADGAPDEVKAWASAPPTWTEVADSGVMDSSLPQQLGAGEREAISLALRIHADVLLMDDQPGRVAAEARGLVVSGTLSVLLQAARLGFIDFEQGISEIKRLGFRMSVEVEARMRALAGHP